MPVNCQPHLTVIVTFVGVACHISGRGQCKTCGWFSVAEQQLAVFCVW